jgi:putative membrane protein
MDTIPTPAAGAPGMTAAAVRSPLPVYLFAFYALFWVALAIAPLDRTDWLLENMLVFAGGAWLIRMYFKRPLSNASYILLTIFFCLHTIGSHYTYSEAPIGFWIRDLFGLERNHYDRIVHFSFGLLMCYPLQELIARTPRPMGNWPLFFAVTVVATCSETYEIIEWLAAMLVSPEAALAFLGTQGDVFDAQKDSALAAIGAIGTALFVATVRKRRPAPASPGA